MVKLTDPLKLHSLGWKHSVELENGIKTMYDWYLGICDSKHKSFSKKSFIFQYFKVCCIYVMYCFGYKQFQMEKNT